MNYALLKAAVAKFNEELDEVMVFAAVSGSPKLLWAMMDRARAAERPDIADEINAAIIADETTPAHKLYHNNLSTGSANGAVRTDHAKMETRAEGDGAHQTPRTCIYLVKPDEQSPRVECGQPATHRAADNRRLLYCRRHAEEVSKRFQVKELSQPRQPIIRQHTLP